MYIARRAASNEEIGLIMQGLIEKKNNSRGSKQEKSKAGGKGIGVNDTLTSDEADGAKDSSPIQALGLIKKSQESTLSVNKAASASPGPRGRTSALNNQSQLSQINKSASSNKFLGL